MEANRTEYKRKSHSISLLLAGIKRNGCSSWENLQLAVSARRLGRNDMRRWMGCFSVTTNVMESWLNYSFSRVPQNLLYVNLML